MANLNQATGMGVVRRQEHRRCSRRKVLERGEMVPVDMGPMESALLLDISARGAGIQGLKPLNAGLRLSLRFQLPNSDFSIQPTYEVVWSDPDGKVGLKFLYMAEREQRQLEEWLGMHSAQQVEAEPLAEILDQMPPFSAPEPARLATTPNTASLAVAKDLRTKAAAFAASETELAALSLDEALVRLVTQAVALTNAEGAAIALRAGQGIVCRASTGNAPDVGAVLNPDSGLSGECIRTGKIVSCEDAANDPRVDPAIARELNLRAIAIVPIRAEGATAGLVEVLSSRPGAFKPPDIANLERVAEIVSFLTNPTVALESELAPEESALFAAELASLDAIAPEPPTVLPATEPLTSAPDQITRLIELLEPELRPAETDFKSVASARPVAKPPTLPSFEVESSPAPTRSLPAQDASRIAARSRVPANRAVPVPTFGIEPRPSRLNRATIASATIAGLILFVAIGGWLLRSGRFSLTSAGPPPTLPPNIPTSSAPAQPQLSLSPALLPAATPSRPAGRSKVESRKLASTIPVSKPSAPAIGTPFPALNASSPSTLPAAAPESIQPANTPSTSADAHQPGASSSTTLTSSAGPAATAPTTPSPAAPATAENPGVATITAPEAPRLVRVAAEVMHERLISSPNPNYPVSARQAGIVGSVVLGVRVGVDGRVRSASLISGSPVLGRAAADAVKLWRYQPYLVYGKPVEVDTTVTVKFTIPGR